MMEYDLLQDLANMFKETIKGEGYLLTWRRQAQTVLKACREVKEVGCSDETHQQLTKEIDQAKKSLEEDEAKIKQRILDWFATEIMNRLE